MPRIDHHDPTIRNRERLREDNASMKATKAVLIAWMTVTVLMAGFAVAQEETPRMIGQGHMSVAPGPRFE